MTYTLACNISLAAVNHVVMPTSKSSMVLPCAGIEEENDCRKSHSPGEEANISPECHHILYVIRPLQQKGKDEGARLSVQLAHWRCSMNVTRGEREGQEIKMGADRTALQSDSPGFKFQSWGYWLSDLRSSLPSQDPNFLICPWEGQSHQPPSTAPAQSTGSLTSPQN